MDRIDARILAVLQGTATPADEARVNRWRTEHPDHERRFRELEEVWRVVGRASPVRDEDAGAPPDLWTLLQEADAASGSGSTGLPASRPPRDEPRDPSAPLPRSTPAARTALRYAAAGLAAASLVALGLGLASWAGQPPPEPLLTPGEVVTGMGEMATVTLEDGSTIRLGPQSRLRLSRGEGSHEIWLEGRAFFGIPHNPARTFRVTTRYGDARVLGTRFEVRAENDEFRVLVVEGRVRVAAGDREAEITAGEMTRSRGAGTLSTLQVSDFTGYLGWMGNTLVFQSTPLGEALREVERVYELETVLEDPALAGLRVTATFTGQEVSEVLVTLCEVIGAACSLEDGRARIGVDRDRPGLRIN